MSHGDSTISHPRDQDYLSLWVDKRYEVELQQATSIYLVANIYAKESEKRRQSTFEKSMIKK